MRFITPVIFLALALTIGAVNPSNAWGDSPSNETAEGSPLKTRYLEALIPIVDQLVSTQITDPDDPDYGALVSASTNPQMNPRHSRAAEAVYPLGVAYKHTFSKDSYSKTVELNSAAGVQIIEPFVNNVGNSYTIEGSDTFVIADKDGKQWQVKINASNIAYSLSHGEESDRYYYPYPGINCYPLTITLMSDGPATLTYTISAR